MVLRSVVQALMLVVLPNSGVLTTIPSFEPVGYQQADSRAKELAEADKLNGDVVKLYAANKYDEAIPLAKRARKIREKWLMPDDRLLADTYGNLAMLYVAKLNFDDAEDLLKRSLAIYEKDLESDSLLLAKTLESLALVRFYKNDPKKAEQFYLRAIALKEKQLGANSEETIDSVHNLAEFYRRQKDYEKAAAMLQRVIAARENKPGQSDQELGKLLEQQACMLYNGGRPSEAEKVEARANHILYESQANTGQPLRLSNEGFMCKLINNPRPDYMSVARGRRFPGPVKLAVEIETDETGNVTNARFIGYDLAFKTATEKAALGAKLRPTVVDGRAVRVKGVITHEFTTMTRMVVVPVTIPGRQY